jgi:Tfp pilus assembly protein PilF
MKIQFLALCFIISLSACGKKRENAKLAQNFYQLAMVEISGKQQESIALRKGLEYIEKALEHNKRAEYLAVKATILFLLHKHKQSKQLFKLALQSTTDERIKADISNNYACVLAQQNHHQGALKLWRKLASNQYYLTPEVALVNQGKVYAQQGKLELSRNFFSQAINQAPSFIDAHYFLALIAHELNDSVQAKHEVKTVLFMEQQHAGALVLASRLGIIADNS